MGSANELRDGVRRAYSEAARHPRAAYSFPVGREFAESLGYPRSVLDSLPASAVEAFSGVSNVSMFAALEPDSTVLDLGCGAGLDSLIAAQRVGPGGRVVGIDFSKAMLERAKHAARSAPINNITVLSAAAEKLPLADATIDTALVNGVFNLNPERADIFAELARVMRPGGTAYAAELILKEPLPSEVRQDEASWFA